MRVPPPSGRAQLRPASHVRPVQHSCPAAPQGSQVSGPAPTGDWQDRLSAAQVPPLPPQQASPWAPQAVQMPVLLFVSPVHSVPTAVQVRLLGVPQQG